MAHEHGEGITEKDAEAIEKKAGGGELDDGQVDIERVTIALPLEDFPQLEGEGEGDKVVVVLSGYVGAVTDDQVFVEFDYASLVHGKMTPGQKHRVMKLEEELGGRKGVKNKYALSRHIALRGKK